MSNLEHYFENLLYHGEDVYGGINKQSLTPDVQDAVEVCAQYVIYSLFGNRKAFEKFINEGSNNADPERKKGKWLWIDGVCCSNCNHKLQTTGLPTRCPNCGADMRGDNDAD